MGNRRAMVQRGHMSQPCASQTPAQPAQTRIPEDHAHAGRANGCGAVWVCGNGMKPRGEGGVAPPVCEEGIGMVWETSQSARATRRTVHPCHTSQSRPNPSGRQSRRGGGVGGGRWQGQEDYRQVGSNGQARRCVEAHPHHLHPPPPSQAPAV